MSDDYNGDVFFDVWPAVEHHEDGDVIIHRDVRTEGH